MLDRFCVLYPLVVPLTLTDCEKPSPDVLTRAIELRDKLCKVHSTMVHCQSDADSNDLAMVRALFNSKFAITVDFQRELILFILL